MKKFQIYFFLALFLGAFLAGAKSVKADLFDDIKTYGGLNVIGSQAYQYADYTNPKTPYLIIADAIKISLSALGILFVLLIVIAGFFWLFAGGKEDRITTSRGIIFHAIIGLLIILTAYSIATFVIQHIIIVTQQGDTYTGTFTP